MAQLLKNPPAMQETWVQSLGWEDPLEKGKATHSSILAWRIHGLFHGVAKSWTRLCNNPHINAYMWNLGEGNGNPLQYSCLGNSMDRAAWRATVYGVLKSWTGGGNGNPLQYSCLEDPMGRGAWRATV